MSASTSPFYRRGIIFSRFLLGGAYRRLTEIVVQMFFAGRTDSSIAGYVFVRAISALARIPRTISGAAIAFETTGGNSLSFATVLVALMARTCEQLSLYEMDLRLGYHS